MGNPSFKNSEPEGIEQPLWKCGHTKKEARKSGPGKKNQAAINDKIKVIASASISPQTFTKQT
jgi:hypothetical protein